MLNKVIKDRLIKLLFGGNSVPRGLFELTNYFRLHGPIKFEFKQDAGVFIAISKDFIYGKIITHGKDIKELDKNIKDAILTSFEIPSSYEKEAGIHKVIEGNNEYAFA